MNQRLYLFNPDHDLVLANGDENFNTPRSARTFATDLQCLPVWYAEPGGLIQAGPLNQSWFEKMQQLFPQLSGVSVESDPDFSQIISVRPWGWNVALRKLLLIKGIQESLIPKAPQLEQFRKLSHRATALELMRFLHEDVSLSALLPEPARILTAGEVEPFAAQYPRVVFKAPWSGSGKGLCWSGRLVSKNSLGWCRNIIEKQGCVVGEEVYDKVQDFAMEFFCNEGKASFAGYSLFNTDRGVYKGNTLLSDAAIFDLLTHRWLPEKLLLTVQQQLVSFIEQRIAPVYHGSLGIDMFVFQRANNFYLHPCVEINVRLTMGQVAHGLYHRFVDPEKSGSFCIDYCSAPSALWNDHCERKRTNPLVVEEGRIKQGYLSLVPVTANTHYRARVEVGTA